MQINMPFYAKESASVMWHYFVLARIIWPAWWGNRWRQQNLHTSWWEQLQTWRQVGGPGKTAQLWSSRGWIQGPRQRTPRRRGWTRQRATRSTTPAPETVSGIVLNLDVACSIVCTYLQTGPYTCASYTETGTVPVPISGKKRVGYRYRISDTVLIF